MVITALTLFHVALSLVGIASGLIVLLGLFSGNRLNNWTAIFLITTVGTSVTGFFFPFERLLPSHVVGIISLVVLAIAIYARYLRHLSGIWRRTYVIGAIIALYLNVFVLVVQAFQKVPFLKEIAPTQSEPPFALAQFVVFAAFIGCGVTAVKKFTQLGS